VSRMGLSDTDMVMASALVAARNRRFFLTSGATSPQLPSQVPENFFVRWSFPLKIWHAFGDKGGDSFTSIRAVCHC